MSEGAAMLFEPLIGAKSIGKLLGISERQVLRLIDSGRLQGVRVGHRVLVEPAVLRAFVAANRTGEGVPSEMRESGLDRTQDSRGHERGSG